jgi:uncharacterized sporulation protein YeaH/YhbH (DUF444 family)
MPPSAESDRPLTCSTWVTVYETPFASRVDGSGLVAAIDAARKLPSAVATSTATTSAAARRVKADERLVRVMRSWLRGGL